MLQPSQTKTPRAAEPRLHVTPAARRSIGRWTIAVLAPLLLVVVLVLANLQAAELLPAAESYQIESFGPNYPITSGAWYTNPQNSLGAGYNYVNIYVPCGWPSAVPIEIDLYDAEMHTSNTSDEPRANGAGDTTFELYGPGTTIGPGLADPGPGAAGSIVSRTYAPSGTTARYARFYTLPAPVACGAYLLRSAAQDDDGNVWRVRVGYDLDGNPNNRPPLNYDNPDGNPGTGDEITLAGTQISYKHPKNPSRCLSLYEYVAAGKASISFHNFDMEAAGIVTYYNPSGVAFPGTPSGKRVWNNGTTTSRGTGDVIQSPEPGWWRIETCTGSDVHFIQEGQRDTPAFNQQPPMPRMTVSKDDGRTVVHPNELLTYTIAFGNDSDQTAAPGAAWNVAIEDALPANTTYQGCAFVAPLTGSCGLSAGVASFRLDGKIDAGASGQVLVTVKANPATSAGTIVNDVALSYTDDLGNPFGASASDTDALVVQADLSLAKRVDNPSPHAGEQLIYTIVVRNDGPDDATDVAVSDPLPADVSFVSATASQGGYDAGTGAWNVGALASGASAQLDIAVLVDVEGTITNTAQVSAAGQPDPDSTPNNNDPNEDDQASVTTPIAPTAVTLTAFTARARGKATRIDWSTSQELSSWGFDLYRSDDGSWESAARVTPQPILARGRGQSGADYSWDDTTGAPGPATVYWLVETETGGTSNRYGPAAVEQPRVGDQRQVFVPLIVQ